MTFTVRRHVVVVGLMGSGKTTIGARLATLLDRPHRDSDADIEATQGLTARRLAERDGIEALHALERQHLLEAIADPHPNVVSAAASTIDDETTRAALQRSDVTTVWLRGTPARLASRLSHGDHRPEFGADLEAIIAEQAARRDPLFEAVADVTVDVDETRPKRIAAKLAADLGAG